jgi:hypothetical protein
VGEQFIGSWMIPDYFHPACGKICGQRGIKQTKFLKPLDFQQSAHVSGSLAKPSQPLTCIRETEFNPMSRKKRGRSAHQTFTKGPTDSPGNDNLSTFDLHHRQLLGYLGRIYGRFRSSCLNRTYYGRKLNFYKRLDKWLDIGVAIGTSVSVSAWSISNKPGGLNFWTVVAGITAIVALIKPFLQLQTDIERFTNLHSGHTRLYSDLEAIVSEIKTDEKLTKEVLDRFIEADERYRDLIVVDDLKASKRLAVKCEAEVRQAFPASYFWNPSSKGLPPRRTDNANSKAK